METSEKGKSKKKAKYQMNWSLYNLYQEIEENRPGYKFRVGLLNIIMFWVILYNSGCVQRLCDKKKKVKATTTSSRTAPTKRNRQKKAPTIYTKLKYEQKSKQKQRNMSSPYYSLIQDAKRTTTDAGAFPTEWMRLCECKRVIGGRGRQSLVECLKTDTHIPGICASLLCRSVKRTRAPVKSPFF